MLRSASDQGSEELVQCIETFQQLSLESLSEPPQVLLRPQHLPWNENLEANGEDIASKILTSIQHIDKEIQIQSEGGEQQRVEHRRDDLTSAIETTYMQTRGQTLYDNTISVPPSSASTLVPSSLADGGHTDDTTTAVTLAHVDAGRPHESSSQGATGQEALSHDDHDDELNQFDDDTSSDGSESVQVLHVDDPRLAFGQSVYVGRRDTEQFTYSQSHPSLGRNVEGPSSDVSRRSSRSVHTVTAPSSISGELQLSPSDSLSRPPPLAPPTASSAGSMLPLPPAAMGTVPPVSVPSVMPTSVLGTQHSQYRPFQMPSVAQSVPASMPFGSSHAPVSSLGVSASMPPLRARAVDEERSNEPGLGLSEVSSMFIVRERHK